MIPEAATGRTPRRFSADEYYRMMHAGILREEPGLELIDGIIVERPRMTPREASVRARMNARLHPLSELGAQIHVNGPLRLDQMNETEPDLVVVRHQEDYYTQRHPAPRDVLLIIEIGDGSFAAEREARPAYYARYDVNELWVVDAVNKIIHVCRNLRDGEYQDVSQMSGEQTLAPQAFPDFVASVRSMIEA